MVAFGGAGGLFATEVADFLGITTIISPPDPGNLCAFGLHVSRRPARLHPHPGAPAVVRPTPTRSSPPGMIWHASDSPTSEAEGIPEETDRHPAGRRRPLFRRGPRGAGRHSAELAGRGGAWPSCGRSSTRSMTSTFGFNYEGEQDVELVNLRVQAVGMQHRPSAEPTTDTRVRLPSPSATARSIGARPAGSNCPLYRRTELAFGQTIARPGDRRGIRLDRRGAAVVVAAARRLRQSHPGKDG